MLHLICNLVTTTTTAEYIASAYWSFDNNALELYNSGLDATPSGSPTYTTSFTGYGAAISLTRSSNQYVYITPKVLPLNSRSFTIELWIYPIGLSTSSDYGLFGQCQATAPDSCFHFIIRGNKLFCGFFANDVGGATTITMNTWHHVACVYDSASLMQQVWFNGYVDGSRSASGYRGLWGNTTIGATFEAGSSAAFNGYIDSVRYECRAKNATEILNDATLHVYHSFNNGSVFDDGPNGINGSTFGNVSSAVGRVNGAVQFISGPYVSYSYNPYFFLGISNYPHSIVLWVKPTGSYTQQTLVFVGPLSIGWCVHFLMMTSSGQLLANSWNGSLVTTSGPTLPLNTWTHVGYTYSTTNGLRLYINGTIYSSTGVYAFLGSNVPVRIVLGSERVVH